MASKGKKYPKEMLLDMYKTMLSIRAFETKAAECFTKGMLAGNIHLCIGQEAVPTGACYALEPEDYMTSTHRGHGHCIAKGAELDKALAELMGKATGYCKGRGGSMHIADLSVGNLGANAIVGGGIPIAVGAALAIKKQGRKNVAVSFFGDSASNEGTFHEALNMAAIWKLPVIFVCENNGFGISVPQWQSTAVQDISVRAKAYGIPGYTGFGNDVNEVDKLFMKAKKRALDGEGPTLLEFKTYRFRGHWTGDPEPYRTREEVKDWKENKDPLKLYSF